MLIIGIGVTEVLLDSCTACGRIAEVSKEQAEAAAQQVGADLR